MEGGNERKGKEREKKRRRRSNALLNELWQGQGLGLVGCFEGVEEEEEREEEEEEEEEGGGGRKKTGVLCTKPDAPFMPLSPGNDLHFFAASLPIKKNRHRKKKI